MKEKAIQQEDLLLVTLENSPDSQHWWISAVWLPRPRWVLISQKALEAEVIFWLPRFFFFFFFKTNLISSWTLECNFLLQMKVREGSSWKYKNKKKRKQNKN